MKVILKTVLVAGLTMLLGAGVCGCGSSEQKAADEKKDAKAKTAIAQPKTAEELANELELPKEKVTDTLRVAGRHISVDAPFADGEDNSLLDVLVNTDSPNADRGLINESLATEVERALEILTEREGDIIRYFFGIGCSEMTLEEIGEKFDLTRERVRQIKEKAIRKLRQSSRSKFLKSYLG